MAVLGITSGVDLRGPEFEVEYEDGNSRGGQSCTEENC
jgi:hypothetical protein